MPIEFNSGIRIAGTELWLDATRARDLSFVSHAHYDHAVRHKRAILSKGTAVFYEHRVLQRRKELKTDVVALEFGEPFELGDLKLTLLPSGHILGSAQIMIETDRRVIYTGDFKLEESVAAERIQIEPCDVLIMECTYGQSKYVFPDRKILARRLVDFAASTLGMSLVPVVYAYSLGKSQEAMKILGDAGFDLLVDDSIFEIARIYEHLGVQLGSYEPFRPELADGRVVILPPGMRRSASSLSVKRRRTAMLTGWALDSHSRWRYSADELIPLSDHCDFAELLAYVELARPKKVYTFHGPAEFAKRLRRRGYDAEHLPLGQQLRLWEDL
jgi:Cft2 family RNA processing exonuclease